MNESQSSEVNREQNSLIDLLDISCNGQRKADFHPHKCISKCIKFQGKWLSPPEFESLCGLNTRKWRQAIKHNGKPLGDWLESHKSE